MVSVTPLRQMEESQLKSRASRKRSLSSFTEVAHIGESTTVMEYVLLFIARPAETSSRQSRRADLLIAGRINNSLFGALARAEGTVCCRVQIVVKIMRLSKVCLKLKDGNNCTNPAHHSQRGRRLQFAVAGTERKVGPFQIFLVCPSVPDWAAAVCV